MGSDFINGVNYFSSGKLIRHERTSACNTPESKRREEETIFFFTRRDLVLCAWVGVRSQQAEFTAAQWTPLQIIFHLQSVRVIKSDRCRRSLAGSHRLRPTRIQLESEFPPEGRLEIGPVPLTKVT